jgi:hypothetical protein
MDGPLSLTRRPSPLPTASIPGSRREPAEDRDSGENPVRIGRPPVAGREREANAQTNQPKEHSMKIFTKHIPAAIRPAGRPHNNPHNLRYLHMKNQPILSRLRSSATNRLGWASLIFVMGLFAPFYAIYVLIVGSGTDKPDPLELFLEKWISSQKLDGWYFSDPKNMEDSLRLDAVTATSRRETHFLQFKHPVTHREIALGFTADGVAARYEFVPQEGDPDHPVLRFVSELPAFRNEEELTALLEAA